MLLFLTADVGGWTRMGLRAIVLKGDRFLIYLFSTLDAREQI
ncbi:hypothetical protein QUA42_14715 [Microcoleus sp. Pol11C2]